MQFVPKKREQGSMMVISIVTCLVIATVLASYLALISSRYNLTVRSMGWNSAIPVLEAGVEEALTHLHDDALSTDNGWTAGTYVGQAVVSKTRTFTDGSYAWVNIANAASTNPIIYSSGFVPAPLRRGYISRTVRVTATKAIKTFSAGISANGAVTLNSGIFDSYNSCLGAYSTNNSMGTNGAIATNSQGVPAVTVSGAHIYGTVTTGPLGTVTYSTGSVGDKDWNASSTGIQAGWTNNNMNVAFPTNGLPSVSFTPMPNPTALGGSNATFLPGGNYSGTTFSSLLSSRPLIVQGNSILYLSGTLNVQGTGYIKILPGASLTLYAGGSTTSIGGGGVINGDGVPAKFSYIGLPSNTNLVLSGGAAFVGTINAPQALLNITGTNGVFGAAIVNTYRSNVANGGGFHYDECLGVGGSGLLTITSWVEL